jgi:hypothetical protein
MLRKWPNKQNSNRLATVVLERVGWVVVYGDPASELLHNNITTVRHAIIERQCVHLDVIASNGLIVGAFTLLGNNFIHENIING